MEQFQQIKIGSPIYTKYRDPDECPICHHAIKPEEQTHAFPGTKGSELPRLEIVYQCPRHECRRLFIGAFKGTIGRVENRGQRARGTFVLMGLAPVTPQKPEFSEEIVKVSPNFEEIYAQASAADSWGLDQICGPGYRKALEFLVKDYCKKLNPEKEEEILKAFLGSCIKEYVEDGKVKECAKRATWLGNDETHYVRKWGTKDIEDLRTLIRLVVNWIESDVLTNQYLKDMP